jgi:hypothetical protein
MKKNPCESSNMIKECLAVGGDSIFNLEIKLKYAMQLISGYCQQSAECVR